MAQAEREDNLSRVPGITRGQAEILRSHGISTTAELAAAVDTSTAPWEGVKEESPQLRAEGSALAARARALQTGEVQNVHGRRTALMPGYSSMSVFLTIHFDPGSGIAFSMGASRVYWPPERDKNAPPIKDDRVFVVDRVDGLNPETERARLVEFADLVGNWLLETHDDNQRLRDARHARGEPDSSFGKASVHVFFWDPLEVTQLKRMVERHMLHPDVIEVVELLARLFPPESVLPDPNTYKSQPGTVVKEVIKRLVGLPLPHDYTLFETANAFHPDVMRSGETFEYRLPFGFHTPMSDQIPFERAYELWEDRIYLKRPSRGGRGRRRPDYRQEIQEGIEHATKTRMRALRHVVDKLREYHREQLILQKPPFSAARPTERRVPTPARGLIAFEELNVAADKIKNRQSRALPVEEREARFISVRGLLPGDGDYGDLLDDIRDRKPRYRGRSLLPFTFAPSSRDARVKERDFLLALSNEEPDLDLDIPWRKHEGLGFGDARDLLAHHDLDREWMVNLALGRLLQVEVAQLGAAAEPPYVVLTPSHAGLFTSPAVSACWTSDGRWYSTPYTRTTRPVKSRTRCAPWAAVPLPEGGREGDTAGESSRRKSHRTRPHYSLQSGGARAASPLGRRRHPDRRGGGHPTHVVQRAPAHCHGSLVQRARLASLGPSGNWQDYGSRRDSARLAGVGLG